MHDRPPEQQTPASDRARLSHPSTRPAMLPRLLVLLLSALCFCAQLSWASASEVAASTDSASTVSADPPVPVTSNLPPLRYPHLGALYQGNPSCVWYASRVCTNVVWATPNTADIQKHGLEEELKLRIVTQQGFTGSRICRRSDKTRAQNRLPAARTELAEQATRANTTALRRALDLVDVDGCAGCASSRCLGALAVLGCFECVFPFALSDCSHMLFVCLCVFSRSCRGIGLGAHSSMTPFVA